MQRVVRVRSFTNEQRERAARAYQWAARQPSWVTKFALLAFLIVIGIPVFIILMLAVVASVIVFGGLAALNLLVIRLRSLLPHADGRSSNVRVIDHRDE